MRCRECIIQVCQHRHLEHREGGIKGKDMPGKNLTKREVHLILKSCFGWGDAKRKLCAALGIPYEWNVELPDYIMKHIREYYGFRSRRE